MPTRDIIRYLRFPSHVLPCRCSYAFPLGIHLEHNLQLRFGCYYFILLLLFPFDHGGDWFALKLRDNHCSLVYIVLVGGVIFQVSDARMVWNRGNHCTHMSERFLVWP